MRRFLVGVIMVCLLLLLFIRRQSRAQLSLLYKAKLIIALLYFKFTWGDHDCRMLPSSKAPKELLGKVKANKKFMSADSAVAMIPDGAVVNTSGFPTSERCIIFFWAVRERFLKTGSPKNLTWVSVGAQGARGKAPGSVEELDPPGLLQKYISGHLETAKALLRAGANGTLELYNMPQGTITQLIKAQSLGEEELTQTVGVGTFFDPRVGNKGRITANCTDTFVTISQSGNELVYRLPHVTVCMFNARYCDEEGNVYLHGNTTLTETLESAAAAKRHAGIVLVSVQSIRPKKLIEKEIAGAPSRFVVPAVMIDAIVVHDGGGVRDPLGVRDKLLPAVAPVHQEVINKTWYSMRFLNRLLKITPYRSEADVALGRLASVYFLKTFQNRKGSRIASIGVGLPEEVGHNLFLQHICPGQITLVTETGTVGGLPGMGVFFGNSINPDHLITSSEMFDLFEEKLNTACLGAAEVDQFGNVNVSRKGDDVTGFIGSGGFSNMVDNAKNVVFVFQWATWMKIQIRRDGKFKVVSKGEPKFVEKVREITFSGQAALRKGTNVYYVTHVGVFELSRDGLVLTQVMPGVDIQKDIVDFAKFPVIIPHNVSISPISITTGTDFVLQAPD